MSFVISRKQYLAPSETRIHYEPMLFDIDGLDIGRIDVGFGHPLYTAVADIMYAACNGETSAMLPVIPDGCMALVCRCKDEDNSAYFCGAIDEVRKIEIQPGECYVFIRFLPGIGYSLVKSSAGRLGGNAIPVEGEVVGGEQILSILQRETHLVERIRLISKVIRVQMVSEPDEYLIKYCTERLFSVHGNLRIEELAEETGFTSRHIGKMFERCVGISPKLFSQIMRLQMSMERIQENREKLLVDIAVDCGFFDHAHMNRVYRKLLHCSSGEFRKCGFTTLDYDTINDYISVR